MLNLLKEWKSKKPKQKLFVAAGLLSLVVAVAGVFLPVVPQVPFALLAAYFFSKGSKRLHKWVRENKFFGQPVRDWEDHKVVRPKLKALSTLAMVGGGVLGYFKLPLGWALAVDAIFVLSIVFVLTRKSNPPRHHTPR